MPAEEILNLVKEYYEEEYQDAKRCIEKKYAWTTPKDLVKSTINRCLGIAQFVQYLGVPYEDLDIYDEYKEKLEKLLTTE
jgi:hypothetical protein